MWQKSRRSKYFPSKATTEENKPPGDDSCVICLEACNDRGHLETCRHIFCFECILQWSKVTNTCPLCKTEFKSIKSSRTNKTTKVSAKKQTTAEEPDNQLDIDGDAIIDDFGYDMTDGFVVPDLEVDLMSGHSESEWEEDTFNTEEGEWEDETDPRFVSEISEDESEDDVAVFLAPRTARVVYSSEEEFD